MAGVLDNSHNTLCHRDGLKIINMQNIKVVAFDCDGVMFDTLDLNKAYYNRLLSRFGQPLMNSVQLNFVHMHTVDESVAYLFDNQELEAVCVLVSGDWHPT